MSADPALELNEDRCDTNRRPKALPCPRRSAPRRPHSFTTHGITVTDDYAWLKDAKWQEVLRDPSILDPDIRQYLEAENDYTESLLGHTAALQKKLVAEMRGRIKEDDSSVPAPDGPFAYLRKFREGGQHEMFGRTPRDGGEVEDRARRRRAGGERQILQVRRRAAFAGPQAAGLERRHQRLGIFLDPRARLGRRRRIATTSSRKPTAAWSGARTANSFFYVKLDDNHRPMQVWRHRLGTKQADDMLVYEEAGFRLVHPSA